MTNRIGVGLRWGGLLTVLAVAVMRCATNFPPQVWFDVDPAFDPTRLTGLGPAGSLGLDAVLWLGCALVLGGEWLTKRGLEGKLLVLALLPLPVVLYHGWDDGGDLWRGSTWAAGAMAAVAVAHLVRDARMRPVVLGILLAVCGPLLCRGVMQMTVEHEATVAEFEQHKAAYFADRSWTEDTPAARIYERRLRQPQPLGWFDTANIFGSMMAFSLVAFLGLAWESVRRKLPSGFAGTAGLLAMAAAAGLVMTGSKGAMLAAGVGITLFLLHQWKKFNPAWVRFVVPGLMGCTILGVVFRGLLPEGFLGDKSLLFRWHYLVSSKGIFLDHPGLGVGPDGFQQAYMLHRVPRNPEEVMSAHSMFVDWICSLGVMGLAWVGLVVLLAWRSGRREAPAPPIDCPRPSRSAPFLTPVLIGGVGLGAALATEWHTITGQDLVMRITGLIGFILLAWVLIRLLNFLTISRTGPAFGGALAALLIHSQIEMTFHQPGAVVWAMCAVGAIGGVGGVSTRSVAKSDRSRWGWIIVLLCAAGGGIILMRGALPAWRQERLMAKAAILAEQAGDRAGERKIVADRLLQAHEAWPINVRSLEEAARQYQRVAALSPRSKSGVALQIATRLAERSVREHGKTYSIYLLSLLQEQRAIVENDPGLLMPALETAKFLAQLDPQGIHAWVRLGDLYWKVNQIDDAKDAYRKALQHSLNFELDPLKQMPQRVRTRLEKRVRK